MLEQTLTLPIGDPAVETFPARLLTPIILKTHVLTACIALAAGLLLAVWPRFVEQLVPSTSYLVTSSWSVWLGGIALGCIISTSGRWLGIGASGWRICLSLGLAVWTIALLAAFPWMVYRLVEINSRISQPEFLALIRGLLPSLVLLPTGIVCGLCATKLSLPDTESSAVPNGPRLALPRVFEFLEWPHGYVLLGLAAYGFAQWRLIPDWGVASGLLLAAAILGCGALSQMLFPLTLPQDFRIRGLVAASLAVIASGPVWQANYQPAVSARLLFTTQVLVAVRNGQRPESLPVLDEGRNTVQAEGSRGTYTTWKYSGSQFQIRENGIPKGTVSRDTEVHPNYSAELLQIVVPLVLHERAQRLLILGLGAGVPLRAALASPVREITCAETDPALVKLVGEIVDGSPDAIDWQDERLQLRIVDPALFVATTHQTFDVIISNPNQSALFQGAADYNREFYARVARRLTPQGIFCQRFQFVDYGPGPLRAMVRTLRTTFQDVLALEMAPGELLFVATNDSRGLVRPALLGRLEAPHIRKLLSEVGWDWSLLLTLGAYNRAGLDKFAAQVPGPINSAVNGYFLFRLPREMMSWGYKAQEVHAALSPQMQRLADWIGQDGNKPEVLRRLSEVVAQQNIMAKFPDQYWAYRSQVRQHLTEKRPAGKIQPVSFEAAEEELEPGDQWRVQYFQSLGRAARSKRLDDIERVEEFTSPFDPLVSYFLHMEVAELLHKAEVGDPAGELRHRMHAAYYASPFDASIHNVIDAMRLQVEHPESAADPAQRWDQLNSLLQMLKTRWELRTTLPAGAPKNVLRDLDLSLVAADKVIDHLDQLRAEAGIRENDWSPRRAFLEANLTHPLRIYRANLLAEAKREIKK